MMRYKKRGFGLFFLCLAFLFSGCSSLNTSEATRLVTNLWQARSGVPAPTAEKLAQVAYLQVTFENGANIYMALGRVNPDNSLTWVSSEGALLTTLNLRPVSSAGWPVNLDQVQPLSADPVEEVKAGYEMLKSLGLRRRGVTVISCPSCARQQFDVIKTVQIIEDRLEHIDVPITVSIIGCVVNGPGEARETDIGLTGGGKGTHQIYLSGMADHRLTNGDIVEHVVDLVETRVAEIKAAEAAADISEKAS